MPPTVVLLVVLFFYGGADRPPQAGATTFDNPDECVAALPAMKQRYEARSDVALAELACVVVDPGTKSKS
jgi:hypothetical protein